MLYKNCRELPIHNFNEVNVTGDLKHLIKDDSEHNQKELQSLWIDIFDEYSSLVKDNDRKQKLKLESDIIKLRFKLNILLYISEIQSKSNAAEKEINKVLKKLKVKDLEKSINKISDSIKIKESQLNSNTDSKENGNFESAIASMKIQGVNVDRYTTSVSEWVALVNQMQERARSLSRNQRIK